ncbi:MAG TPA: hypothetical protein VNZ49_03905 [Bacteroidia bacterium]|jgi:hypothetical protein|nr:hypothetical protein [Bacteroidia bacterium]
MDRKEENTFEFMEYYYPAELSEGIEIYLELKTEYENQEYWKEIIHEEK